MPCPFWRKRQSHIECVNGSKTSDKQMQSDAAKAAPLIWTLGGKPHGIKRRVSIR